MRRLAPIVAALTLACSVGAQSDPGPNLQVVPPGDVTLRQGQTAEVALPGGPSALFITFARIASDSRCPSNVQCVWAGEVAVLLRLSGEASGERTLYLPGGTSGASTTDTGQYRLELKAVTPHPVSGAAQTEPNRITLGISPRP